MAVADLDLALVNGRVRTLDPARPAAAAIGMRSGEVVVVGSDADVLALRGARTEVVDLRGAAAVPGLVDSHLHPFHGTRATRGVDLLSATTLEEVRRRVAAERERVGPGAWVLGWGMDYNAFAASGLRADAVEDAVGDGPAHLVLMDLHVSLASRQALERAGIDGPRDFDEHAEVVCDADGRPTGELREWAALDLVQRVVPELGEEEQHAAYVAQLRAFAAVGLTGVHAMDGDLADLALLARLEADGDLPLRVLSPFRLQPDTDQASFGELIAHRDDHGARWRAGVAKLFIDGVIDAGTGWLCEPDALGEGTAPFWPDPAAYRAAVATFAGAGFQCVTHATGDRAVREALDAYAAVPAPRRGRHRVEHIETIQPEDLPRFAAEGVVASMQVQHMLGLRRDPPDNWCARLGPERVARAFRTRDLLASGALVALGSDWPVAHFDPRVGLAATRLRRTPGTDEAPFDDQALDGEQALRGYTSAPAAVSGDADRYGRLAPSFAGDVTVLAVDPVDADPDELPDVPVLLTVVGGELCHRAEAI